MFAPYWVDAHPDHVAATELIEAARFWSKLSKTDMPGEPHYPERVYHYYCVHLRQIPQPAFILDISDYWEKKAAAITALQQAIAVGLAGERTVEINGEVQIIQLTGIVRPQDVRADNTVTSTLIADAVITLIYNVLDF